MDDYMITVDENGQAYIEHAFWNRKGQTKKNHKYLLKIGEGVKARYFYTKAEVDAYYKNKTGLTKKSQLEEEKKNLRNAEKKAEQNEMKAIKAKRGVRYDRDGNEWYTNMNAANKAYEADLEAVRSANDVKEAKRRVNVAQEHYDNTLSGKAEKAISNIKSKAERMKDEFRNKVERVSDKVEDHKNKKFDVYTIDGQTGELKKINLKDEAESARKRADDYAKKHNGKRDPGFDLVAENAEEAYKDMLHPDRKFKEHTLTETIIPEKRIEETIIPEKRIEETIIPEKRIEETIIPDKYKVYNKKANPINSSGVISFDTLKRDAAEAGVDFSKYNKAANKVEKLAKQLMREASEPKTGIESLVTRMWYDNPEYRKALKEKEEALKELTDILYY